MRRRRLKNEDVVDPVRSWEEDGSVAVDENPKFLPWHGNKDELEPAEINESGRVVKPGLPRFFVNKEKVIAVYKNGKGIARRLYAVLKIPVPTGPEDRIAIEKRRRVLAFKEILRKNGIPGL